MQAKIIRRVATRGFSTQAMASKESSYHMMRKSKHDFVRFINKATLEKDSAEAKQLYTYLVNCFIDNDTDYDGQVSYRGFNSMIAEAALAPRRFGFAPHTRELYSTAEEYETERKKLFNEMSPSGDRIVLESWLNWATKHIELKVGSGLEEHNEARWERSKADYIQFLKGVLQAKSAHCQKSSSSTQMKEHYMNSVRQFSEADTMNHGKLDKAGFERLIKICEALPMKFGLKLYSEWKFEDVSTSKQHVTMKDFLDYKLNYIKAKVNTL